jgi:hypothetical protein
MADSDRLEISHPNNSSRLTHGVEILGDARTHPPSAIYGRWGNKSFIVSKISWLEGVQKSKNNCRLGQVADGVSCTESGFDGFDNRDGIFGAEFVNYTAR